MSSREVIWLDLLSHEGPEQVVAEGEVSAEDAITAGYSAESVNLIYDRKTGMVFTLLGDPWPPTTAVSETLDQYKPGEL